VSGRERQEGTVVTVEYNADVQQERERIGLVEVQLVGMDGNAFSILGRVSRALRQAGYSQEARDAYQAAATGGDYDTVLAVTLDWTTEPEPDDDDNEFDFEDDD
jgi:hypothetical protein